MPDRRPATRRAAPPASMTRGAATPEAGDVFAGTPAGMAAFQAMEARDAMRRKALRDRYDRITGGPAAARAPGQAKGGNAKTYAKGGSASKRADGCAMRGKTKGKMI